MNACTGDAGLTGDEQSCMMPCTSPVSWWSFDDNLTDPISGNNGSFEPAGEGAFAQGNVGEAVALNGSSYVDVANSSSLQVISGFSFVAWINAATLSGRILDKTMIGTSDGYLLDTLSLEPPDGGWVFRFLAGTGDWLYSDSAPPTNQWVHVAITWDGNTLRIYVNGAPAGSIPKTIFPTNDLDMHIGAASDGTYIFNGLIDQVAVYNVALSDAEVAAIAGLQCIPISGCRTYSDDCGADAGTTGADAGTTGADAG